MAHDSIEFFEAFRKQVQETLSRLDLETIARVAQLLYEAKENGNRIFFFGNGGSYSIATHLACDFGRAAKKKGKCYKALSPDNPAWLTADSNDFGYETVFVKQLENFLEPGDVAFAISSSGNSPNILNAISFAKKRGARTVAMVGFDGGKASQIADHVILVPTGKGQYGLVEGIHEVIHHMLYEFALKLE